MATGRGIPARSTLEEQPRVALYSKSAAALLLMGVAIGAIAGAYFAMTAQRNIQAALVRFRRRAPS